MKIKILLIIIVIATTIISCKKNSGAREDFTALGKVQFLNRSILDEDSVIVKIDGKETLRGIIVANGGASPDHIANIGQHQFSVYSAKKKDSLILQQNVNIQLNTQQKITLFRVTNTDSLRVLNINLDTVTAPVDNEHVKISLANFSTHLPPNIDLFFIQQVSNSPRIIDTIARFQNVKKSFSSFQEIRLRKNQGGQLIYALGFVVYNRDTRANMTQMPSASGVLLNANTPKIRTFYLVTGSNGTTGQVRAF